MLRTLIHLSACAALTGSLAYAQQQPPAPMDGPKAPPAPAAPHRGPDSKGFPMLRENDGERRSFRIITEGGMRGDSRIAPPGIWWKDTELAQRIGLTPEQTKKMDDVFLQARIKLLHMKASLEEQELLLEPLVNANPPDSGKALAQIGRVAEMRAELEKANAAMLLGIRGILTPEQWTKLQAERGHRRMMGSVDLNLAMPDLAMLDGLDARIREQMKGLENLDFDRIREDARKAVDTARRSFDLDIRPEPKVDSPRSDAPKLQP